MRLRATPLTGLITAALLAACQTTAEAPPDTPSQASPARTPTARAPGAAGPTAGHSRVQASTAAATAATPEQQPEDPPPAPDSTVLPAPTSSPGRPVPHIYLALQPGGGGREVSAVFAIDAARDNTPSDDPAVRLTPENGLCNPQEMRSYTFPPEDAARPVVSEAEQAQGLTAGDLPAFMAISVTEKMLSLGLASDREQTRALNVCTRKLWERLMVAGN